MRGSATSRPGRTVQACVAAREIKEGMKPPSEPTLHGPALKAMLPLYSLAASPPRETDGRHA